LNGAILGGRNNTGQITTSKLEKEANNLISGNPGEENHKKLNFNPHTLKMAPARYAHLTRMRARDTTRLNFVFRSQSSFLQEVRPMKYF
jgi:hypothetical protein